MSDGREPDAGMKTPPIQKTPKRVPKPVMEKRRRERINNSLEALRLLMVEGTGDEKLKNPKVEKAEILESVVQLLKTQKLANKGPQAPRRAAPREQEQQQEQQGYQNGMRSCMLRFNQFMASKENGAAPGPFVLPGPRAFSSPPRLVRGTLMAAPAAAVAAAAGLLPPPPPPPPPHQLPQPFLGRHYYEQRDLLPIPAVPVQVTGGVWRPWPE